MHILKPGNQTSKIMTLIITKKSEFNPKTKIVSLMAFAIVIYGLCLPGDG